MKKLLVLPLLVVALNSFAGWEMMFCDSVDEKGNCVGKAELLNLSGPEKMVQVVLTNVDGVHTQKIYFEVYLVDPTTFAEDLVTSAELSTSPTALMASQAIHINKKGQYLIKARDSYKDYITSRELTVK
jgi:hypothetical protein